MSRNNALTRYMGQSRDPINGLVLVAPLFIFYQIGILFTDGWKNGADFVTGALLGLLGGNMIAYTVLNLGILGALMVVYARRRSQRTLEPRTWFGVVGESTVYAFFMGGMVSTLLVNAGIAPTMTLVPAASGAPEMGLFDTIVLSVGAGTYEELFFRLILMGAMYAGLLKTRRFAAWQAGLVSILLSSLIFSAFHYPPLGMDPWELWSFAFRFVMGVLFAVLFLTRGFAVAVYTHAIYDIFVLVPKVFGM